MVVIYGSACTTGLAFHAVLTEEQEAEVRRRVEAFEAFLEEGSAAALDDVRAVAEHNEMVREAYEDAGEILDHLVSGVDGVLRWYAESGDGHGESVTPERMLEVADVGGFAALGYE